VSILIATAGAVDANSYTTVARANLILGRRLYTTKWDLASSVPDAEGYLANGAASAGASAVVIDTGAGTFTLNSQVKFAGHDTIYTVTAALSTPGSLGIEPPLTADVADDEVVERQTANEKEKSLIWGTLILDAMMTWKGYIHSTTQRLRWPRSGVLDSDGRYYAFDAIPEILEVGLSEFALVLLERNKFQLPGILGQGIKSIKIGPLSAEIDGMQLEAVIPQNILSLLSDLGYLEPEAQVGMRLVSLRRS